MIYPAQGSTATRPNALLSVAGAARSFGTGIYACDNNGNLATALMAAPHSWPSFDIPLTLTKVNRGLTSIASFTYGPEHQRTKQITRAGLAEAVRDIGT